MLECKREACILKDMKKGPQTPDAYYRVSVKALITDETDKILVVNERGLGWDLPGGGLDWGENAGDALKRELLEELGCTAEIAEHPCLIAPSSAREYDRHVLWIIYKARINPEEIKKTPEVTDYDYVTVQDFRNNEEKYEAMNWESPIDFWGELEKLVKKL